MKKIYVILSSALLSVGAFAQTNLSYESPISNPYGGAGLPEVGTTDGWGLGIYTSYTPASDGNQAVVLATTTNQNFVDILGLPSATQPGQIVQSVSLTASDNAAQITGSVDIQFAPVNGDSAIVIFEVYDTLGVGFADDVLLYSGSMLITSAVANWETLTLEMESSGETGTANELYIGGQASFRQSSPGSALRLDNWTIDIPSNSVAIKEVTKLNFNAYPNPVVDELNFKSDAEITSIEIFSMDGKMVTSNNGSSSINVSNLNAGVYIYEVTNANGAKGTNKFVKK